MTKKGSSRRGIFLSVSLLSGVGAFLVIQGIYQSIICSPRFTVREIELVWPRELNRPMERYHLHPPTSIFKVNLQAVANALSQRYPSTEINAVRRILPNRLLATVREKRAIGQVKVADRYYPVDDEGKILLSGQRAPMPHLPILFLEGSRGIYQVGEFFSHPVFLSTSKLLQGIHRQGGLASHKLNSVRSRGQDLTLVLDSGLEIRFNSDRLEAEWNRLGALTVQKPEILDRAQYIDLRFGDPVIGGVKREKSSK